MGTTALFLSVVTSFLFACSIHAPLLAAPAAAVNLPSSIDLGLGILINLTSSAANSSYSQSLEILESGSYLLRLEGRPTRLTISHLFSEPTGQGRLAWVANYFNQRVAADPPPVANVTSILKFGDDGDLQLLQSWNEEAAATVRQELLWRSGTAGEGVRRMLLLESGNLVLIDRNNRTVWQSFDHPTDTLLPDQKLRSGMVLVAAADSTRYRSGGIYSMTLQDGDLRLYYAKAGEGTDLACYWSLNQSSPYPLDMKRVEYASLHNGGIGLFASDSSVVFASSDQSPQASDLDLLATLDSDGNFRTYFLMMGMFWQKNFVALKTSCDYPSFCGSYGVCGSLTDSSEKYCTCPTGFQARNASDMTQGCQSSKPLPRCNTMEDETNVTARGAELLNVIGSGYTYFSNRFSASLRVGLQQCKQECLQNCSCVAVFYENDIGTCFLIQNELMTIQQISDSNKRLFLKVHNDSISLGGGLIYPPGPKPPIQESGRNSLSAGVVIVIVSSTAATLLLLGICLACCIRRRVLRILTQIKEQEAFLKSLPSLPPRFSYKDLDTATSGFSKKLGAGAFGSVYEGLLRDQTRVAVKRLESSGQGEKEFQAEVATIGSIDHLNLVKLRGFCMEGSHRLLVYDFMAGGSLDKYLLNGDAGSPLLNWRARYEIGMGVARGLAYLHESTARRIIHCDIKPSNILLDEHLTAKISDFGLSKIVQRDGQSYARTTVRGTPGYLAPEWLLDLPITTKSDVYSFGMVLLELVSGQRMEEWGLRGERVDFSTWACSLAKERQYLRLLDDRLCGGREEGEEEEEEGVERLVKTGLWCIQEGVGLRPSMATVVKMLEGQIKDILPPPLPPFLS